MDPETWQSPVPFIDENANRCHMPYNNHGSCSIHQNHKIHQNKIIFGTRNLSEALQTFAICPPKSSSTFKIIHPNLLEQEQHSICRHSCDIKGQGFIQLLLLSDLVSKSPKNWTSSVFHIPCPDLALDKCLDLRPTWQNSHGNLVPTKESKTQTQTEETKTHKTKT